MQPLHFTRAPILPIFLSMDIPDYRALSAKLTQQSQMMCDKCGLTILRRANQSKPCLNTCPARTLLRNAEMILSDIVPH